MPDAAPRDHHLSGVIFASAAFAITTCWVSYCRWATFGYRTFDLAFYVQGLWQFLHGRFDGSILGVPLLGNHVEPVVFLIAPIFALVRHPLTLVVVQNVLLAAMGPVAYDTVKRSGLRSRDAALLAVALLVAPATAYVALHEFHPEAFTAPFILLMLRARIVGSIRSHWVWFIAVLACKENMALLLGAYCAVHLILERRRPPAELRAWYLWPLLVALGWFAVCGQVITPALNAGNVDFLALYNHLGSSGRDILQNAITHPQRIAGAAVNSLIQGNLVWTLLFSFAALPLLRVRWWFVAAPIIFQHLLSWRSSEWMIYFHYAAPLLPLFWFATLESVLLAEGWKQAPPWLRGSLAACTLLACIIAQIIVGPARSMVETTSVWLADRAESARKNAFVAQIPPDASVLAPLPYLSHLAMREHLYSLHHVLKGLKTLSHSSYAPPSPPEFVLIDYADTATFDPSAGYYHPAMRTTDGTVIPSSDELLHKFLEQRSWATTSSDQLVLLRQTGSPQAAGSRETSQPVAQFGEHTQLLMISKNSDDLAPSHPLTITLRWNFAGERDVFPWLVLRLSRRDGGHVFITKGLCAPEASGGSFEEKWNLTAVDRLAEDHYAVDALFFDNAKRAWSQMRGKADSGAELLVPPIPLGPLQISRAP